MLRGQLQKIAHTLQHKRRYNTLNWLELNRSSLLHNVAFFQAKNPEIGVIPVLKGNAYGHGLREVAEILNDANVDLLAVDGYFEAGKIRHITRHRIVVLGYILPENASLLDTRSCSFVVQDAAGLHAFGRLRRPVQIHLELNTGMNRLGLSLDELDAYLKIVHRYPNLQLEGVMSHLADADNPSDDGWTMQQQAAFDAGVERILASGFRPRYIHLAQTAGSVKVRSKYANTMRLGIGQYGINPLSPNDRRYTELQGLRPVMELKSTIIKVIDLMPGDRVSYNGIFTAKTSTHIGILPLGYYEGVPRELGNRGFVTGGSAILPIVGRVNMNHTTIDLGNRALTVGDAVTVISPDSAQPNSLAKLRSEMQLFPYAVLVKVSSSIRRKVV